MRLSSFDSGTFFMKRVNPVVARNAMELARLLGLSATGAVEMQVRRQINDKIIEAVRRSRLTHVQAAKAAGTSRTRLTAILNRNTTHASTDLMLRILLALGYRARISFSRIPRAA
jgi:predicted XRE-type DNA-binding protein